MGLAELTPVPLPHSGAATAGELLPPVHCTEQEQARAELQDSLTARDDEVASLSLQLQRMESALRAVEQMAVGMRRPRHLDRASLDAVSIHQLQAAVDHFGAGDARGRGVLQGDAT
jgi:hypothetical protein